MIRLIYLSVLKPDVSELDLERIVEEAARYNQSIGVSGILAVEDRRICQILEGSEAAVDKLFAKIMRDERHWGVVDIDRRPLHERRFGRWSMVQRPMVDIVAAILPAT